MGIRHEIARGLTRGEQVTEDIEMTAGGVNHAHTRPLEPALDAPHPLVARQRPLVDAGIGADSHEGREHRPAETDGIVAPAKSAAFRVAKGQGWTLATGC